MPNMKSVTLTVQQLKLTYIKTHKQTGQNNKYAFVPSIRVIRLEEDHLSNLANLPIFVNTPLTKIYPFCPELMTVAPNHWYDLSSTGTSRPKRSRWLLLPEIRWMPYWFTDVFLLSFVRLFLHSFVHHSFSQLVIHSFIHSFIHVL